MRMDIHLGGEMLFLWNVSIGAKRVKAVCIILHMCCDREDQQG
jgi:hypothetical protein